MPRSRAMPARTVDEKKEGREESNRESVAVGSALLARADVLEKLRCPSQAFELAELRAYCQSESFLGRRSQPLPPETTYLPAIEQMVG
jgi:hypothetical protein